MEEIKKLFSEIYDKYIDKIYRFVFFKVNSQEKAEDLTSDTFLKTWLVFKKNKDKIENIQAFLYKTANNLVIDYYRQKGKINIISGINPFLADPKSDLEKKAKIDSDIEQMKVCLSELKEDYQNVIIWRYLEDMSIPKIASLLDRTEGATRVLLHRALKSLREEIKENKKTREA